jgi:hypothetical protein
MPNPTPPARYDSPWKAALTHAFADFMAFFFPDLYAQINWSTRPNFRDNELLGIGFGDTPSGLIADKLVEVRLHDGRVQLALIHIEVQAQRDASLARRVLDYNYRIFKEYGQPVASLVLLADADLNWHPREFHTELMGTVMGISFPTAKLLDYADRADALQALDNPFAWVTLAHLRTQQARHDPDALYAAKWQLTWLLFQHRWSRKRILVLFDVINWMMVLPEAYQDRYWQAIVQLEEERKMKWISPLEQSFINKGLQKGLEQGLERGRKEGAAALLERLLTQRFGPLPQAVRNKLAKADVERIEAWSDVLPEAQSLEQLFG